MQKYGEDYQNPKEKISDSVETLENIIIDMKIQLEEAKIIEEAIRCQLDEKKEICEKTEAKNVFLRKELEKTSDQLKFGIITKVIDGILNYQR